MRLLELNDTQAYWYNPDSRDFYYAGGVNHINFVIHNPEIFDFTIDEIHSTYKRHKEPIGTEGKAREEILHRVFSKGWVRLRYWTIGANKKWYIEVKDFNSQRESVRSLLNNLFTIADVLVTDIVDVYESDGAVLTNVSYSNLFRMVENRK